MTYAARERSRVEPLARTLASFDLDVRFEGRSSLKTSLDDLGREKLNAAKAVLVCWTPAAVKDPLVHAEATVGWERQVLVAVMLEPASVPEALLAVPPVDLRDWTGAYDHPGFIPLLEQLQTRLGRPDLTSRARNQSPGSAQAPAAPPSFASRSGAFVSAPPAAPIDDTADRTAFDRQVETTRAAFRLQQGEREAAFEQRLADLQARFEQWLVARRTGRGQPPPPPHTALFEPVARGDGGFAPPIHPYHPYPVSEPGFPSPAAATSTAGFPAPPGASEAPSASGPRPSGAPSAGGFQAPAGLGQPPYGPVTEAAEPRSSRRTLIVVASGAAGAVVAGGGLWALWTAAEDTERRVEPGTRLSDDRPYTYDEPAPTYEDPPAAYEAPPPPPTVYSCGEPVDRTSVRLRTILQYVEESPHGGKNCRVCLQYVRRSGQPCGNCRLFSGPVQPGGYCLSWARQV